MPKNISADVPHQLGQAEARQRIDNGFGRLQSQLAGGVSAVLTWQQRWEGDRLYFSAKGIGQTFSGHLDVLPESIHIEVDLPEFLAAIADKLAGRLKETSKILLEKR